jgi:hypothetical protein
VAFVVKNDTRLDVFLRSNGVQQWRVPILAATDGIVVARGKNKKPIALSGGATPLKAGDMVTVKAPLPTKCVQALQREADTNSRDYAIAPGSTPFDKRIAKFLGVRPQTILIDAVKTPSMADLQGFLKGIATSELITNPIRDLIVASHASGFSGQFRIPLTAGAADTVTYEDLENAVAQKTLVVDVALLTPRARNAGPTPRMRIFGCAAGRVAPFMRKLKEALGNKIAVTAPHHLLVGASFSGAAGRTKMSGELAYMAYAFRVFMPSLPPGTKAKPRKARTKQDIVNAFDAATTAEATKAKAAAVNPADPNSIPGRHMLQDRKWVTKPQWTSWIPDNPEDTRWFPTNPFNPPPATDPHEIRNVVRLPVFNINTDAPRRYQCQLDHSFFGQQMSMALAKDPGTDAGRKAAVKADMQKLLINTAKHPLPQYVRFGYDTIDDFMEGWNWQFRYDAKSGTLFYEPIRDEYSVIVPITKAGVLMMNYYQKAAPPRRFARLIPIENLFLADRFYFSTY